MKKNTIEVFHLYGKNSLSLMSNDLIYKIMDNVTFKKVQKSILDEIEDFENVISHHHETKDVLSRAILRDKKLLDELKDHFEWIER